MASLNLYAEVSKLHDRQVERDAQGIDAKKKQKRTKTTPSKPNQNSVIAKRKKELLKGDLSSNRGSLLASKIHRPSTGIPVKNRKYKDPLNKRLKDVITCLLEVREPMSREEICTRTKYDLADVELWEAVKNNRRIEVLENEKYLYKPQLQNIRNKEDLLMHIRRNPKGTLWQEVSDTYKNVEQDLHPLQKENRIFVIENPDIEDKVVFWNDPRIERAVISDQMMELWKETQPPTDNHIYEMLLKKSGIKLSVRKDAQQRIPLEKRKKPRKQRDSKYRKITNTHMPELFATNQPEQID